jgi:ribosomal protein S18 acetylase RimI-like enzyme
VVSRLVGDPRARTFVAESRELTLGLAVVSVERHRRWGPFDEPRLAHLDAIAVAPEARRRGVARTLLAHAERFASRRGALSMSLMTAVDNSVARKLFAACGYLELVELGAVYAGRTDAVRMFKPLEPNAGPQMNDAATRFDV